MRAQNLLLLPAALVVVAATTTGAGNVAMIEPDRQAAECSAYIGPSDELEPVLEALDPGDVLCLRDGTYGPEDVRVDASDGTATAPITVRAQNRHKATVVGHVEIVDGDYWHIRGLRFTNPEEFGSERIVVLIGGTGWVFEDNEIFDGTYSGLLVGKSSEHGAVHDYTIRHNYIHDTGSSNLYHNPGPDSTGGLIERNIFADAGGNGSNTKLGWGGDDGCDGGNAALFGIGEVTYRFNTLHGGSEHPLIIAERGGKLPVRVFGNLISGSESSHSVRIDNVEGCLGDNVDVSRNAWHGSEVFAWDAGDHPEVLDRMDENVELDPEFNTVSGRDGFVPMNPDARRYGHLAPPHTLRSDAP
jgi:hypothetical protein